ncbi:MAG TPA: GNAT family N-acetyltransferase [Flavisolibacter sp.]|nr:GNAT family N-acetyltransferase [Flavisolibacter sp.]
MQAADSIQYLQRQQVDEAKWNACIDAASNGLVYAYTHYLDCMSDNWDALVLNNYEVVMPLPWRRKGGVHYLYQPSLTAQLGVFGNGLGAQLLQQFFAAVPKKFRYWDFSLNHDNLFAVDGFPLHQRSNYVLPLQPSYEQLYKGYRENIRRNIKKSRDYGCVITTAVDITAIIALTKLQSQKLPEKDFQNFQNLFYQLKEGGLAKTYGVLSAAGELLASCVFFFSHNRTYYILVGNHPNGRTLGASHALIDAFIKDHAGRDLLLDFEGSDIRNLAFFYSSFGAQEEKYAAIKLNRLPWWMKWLKG